jgi:hypothetical protein
MQTLQTASPEEQAIVVKAAEARFTELGIPIETAAILFQNEITKSAKEMFSEKKGQSALPFMSSGSTPGGTLQDFWGALPPMLRSGIVNALVGGGIGALGGAGYGMMNNRNPADTAMQGAGYGALAGGFTPLLSNLLQKFSSDVDGTFNALTKAAMGSMVESGFTEKEAEQILLLRLQKVASHCLLGPKEACDLPPDPSNTKGKYPPFKLGKKDDPKQAKIKKLAADLNQAVKDANCGCGSSPGEPTKPKTKPKIEIPPQYLSKTEKPKAKAKAKKKE